jgi:sulfur-oxidizing protein SoxY
MTADDYPELVHLIALENPFPEIAKYRFTPACGVAEVTLRCRMRTSAPLVVVAEMSTGAVGVTERFVEVTLGACS